MPIERRADDACRIAGGNVGAKKKPMPASARQRSTTAGGAVARTPSASKTSALPERLEIERLPCFATGTPHAATTIAAHDEMLNVPDRSPPVPHVSNTRLKGREIWTACARIARARPTISSGRSPFMARPTRKAAMWASSARPSITSTIAAAASSLERSSRLTSCSMIRANIATQSRRPSRKFRRMRRPSPVRMDSGWNCTP